MTEEAKRCVEILRKATYKDTGYSCNACPIYLSCPSGTVEFDGICMIHTAANLIESLSAQLEAAIRDMGMTAHCVICTHHRDNGGNCCGVSMCGEHRPRWKWRGEVEG